MRIAIFDGSFETTAFIRRLIRGLVQAGHEVYVLGFNENNPNSINDVNYVKLGSNQNKLNFLKTGLLYGIRSGKLLATFCRLAKGNKKEIQQNNLRYVFDQIQPDIVHVQWPSLLPWLKKSLGKYSFKTILSLRGSQINIRPFVDSSFKNMLIDNYKILDGIHSVSSAIKNKTDFISIDNTIENRIIYTGLNLYNINFSEKFKKNDSLKILSIGRSHWVKGYAEALKCFYILKNNLKNFKYDVVGGYNDEELLFLLNELELVTQVNLLPKMPNKKVLNKIKEADILLLPSVEEGIANVAVEAMALGTPVISTDCGGMQELITHKKEGWIVPMREPKAMADAIINFTTLNVNEVNEIIYNARRKVQKQHSEDKMISDMLNLYQTVLKTNK